MKRGRTTVIDIDPDHPRKRAIQASLDALRDGGLIVYPTDTVYGLGCSVFDRRAIEKIYQIKKVPLKKPLSIICADLRHIAQFAIVEDPAFRILKRYTPGPYTFLLRGSRMLPKIMLTKRRTVGIRVPDLALCQTLLAALGHPIISTSVRIGNGEVLTDPEEIIQEIQGRVDVVLDAGIIDSEPSTIVDLTGENPIIIREGKGDPHPFR